MYLGGPEQAQTFLTVYETVGPLDAHELQFLATFRRLRWAVQGTYVAWRLAAHDLTGGVEQADKERGLENA